MFCKKCGFESAIIKKFCINCGADFSATQNNHASHTTESRAPTRVRPPMPKEPWTIKRIIKFVALAVFVCAIIVLKFGLGAANSIDSTAVNTNNKALSAFNSGDNDQAISQFQQASKDAVTNDTKISTLKNLAYVYATEGQNAQALSSFKEALALASDGSYDYYLISGEIALLDDKPNAALLAYNKAYSISPNEYQINNALALFYLDLESIAPQYVDYKNALIYAQRAYDLSKFEVVKQNLAIAYFFNENYGQTISLLSSSDFTKQPYAAYWIGLAYAKQGDVANAKIYMRKAITNGAEVPQEINDYLKNN
jgi:tetratricopeptide (TPR) repeat protein